YRLRPLLFLPSFPTRRSSDLSFVNPTCVFSEQVVVFPTESAGVFSVLQSNIHAVFAWQNSSRMKNDLRYSPTDALATFPFPAVRSEEHTSELQSRENLVSRLL